MYVIRLVGWQKHCNICLTILFIQNNVAAANAVSDSVCWTILPASDEPYIGLIHRYSVCVHAESETQKAR